MTDEQKQRDEHDVSLGVLMGVTNLLASKGGDQGFRAELAAVGRLPFVPSEQQVQGAMLYLIELIRADVRKGAN